MTPAQIPGSKKVARLTPFFLIPFTILLSILFLTAYTPQFAAAGLLVVNENLEFFLNRFFNVLAARARQPPGKSP